MSRDYVIHLFKTDLYVVPEDGMRSVSWVRFFPENGVFQQCPTTSVVKVHNKLEDC